MAQSKRQRYEKLIEEAATNFELFCRIVGKIKPGEHQADWFKVCQTIADDPFGGHSFIIAAPPGSGKSQVIAVLFSAFMIGRYPNEHFGLISYADRPAWDRSNAIRKIIDKSTEYQRIFPNIKPSKENWGTASFIVKRDNTADFHPTLRAGGATSSIVSYRLSGVIVDDPHDPKNANKTELKAKVYTNWEQAIRTRLIEGAFRLVITTRWADDDFAGSLMRKEKGRWTMFVTKAITPTGRSYWPSHYSIETLRELEYQNPITFAIQYMGDTTQGSSGFFKSLATYQGKIVKQESSLRITTGKIDVFNQAYKWLHPELGELDLLIGSGIDTATKDKQKNDFSVIYTGGLDSYGRVWILDRRKGRWMLPKLNENITSVYEEFHPYTIWIEDASSGTPAVQVLKAKMPYMPLDLRTPTVGGKRSRAMSIAAEINSGMVIFPEFADWFEDAQYYITRYGSTDHDDDVDALFMLLHYLLQTIHPSNYELDGRLQADLRFR